MPAPPRPLLLALSHLRWDFVFQRPQHLLTRAAATHDVVFWEEPVFVAADTTPSLVQSPRANGVQVTVPQLPSGLDPASVAATLRRLLDDFLRAQDADDRQVVAWFYTPMALNFADEIDADIVVYDCMDELSAFRGAPPQMLASETALLARADLVFTGGRSLFEAKRDRHPSVHCFPSSIEVEHFGKARGGLADPADQSAIARPRLGFFGVIDERMDIELVAALAALRPEWQIVLIGPTAKVDPGSLPNAANLHWLGGRSYGELPEYLANWDLGIMPFAMNEHTRFISPTKTPEFLAAGLPVISTPVPDVVRDWGAAGLVEIATDAAGFVAAAEVLLRRPREAWRHRVDARLAMQSWDATWSAMADLLDGPLPHRAHLETRSLDHV